MLSHPENEICDQLAVKASQSSNLKIDAFFENQKEGRIVLNLNKDYS